MTLEDNACRQRPDLDREIGPRQSRPQIGVRRTAAPTVADRLLRAAKAFLLGTVVVLGHRVAGRLARRPTSLDERILVAARPRRQRPLPAAIGARTALPAFLAAEIGQHMGVGPVRQSGFGPTLVVAAMTAYIGHGVDR